MMKDEPNNMDQTTVPMSGSMGDIAQTMLRTGMLNAPGQPGVQGAVDRFEIIRTLSTGGMGQVFLAREPVTDGKVALKMIRPDLAGSDWAVKRFLTEAQHMYRISHPNILKVLEVSDREEGPYYVMPYIEAGSLADRMQKGTPLSDELILHVSLQLAEALAFAHGRGIIHRDLKPANVLLDESDCVYLTDFGLLRTVFNDASIDAGKDVLEGTAIYMSPLAAAGKAEDTRCDTYAFGAMLYEMLTGYRPYAGETFEETIEQILAGPPCPILQRHPQASRELTQIAEGCMARELRDRYAEMADVVGDLKRVARGETPLGPHGQAHSKQSFKKGILISTGRAVGSLALVALIGAGAYFLTIEKNPDAVFFDSKLAEAEPGHAVRQPPASDTPEVVQASALNLSTNLTTAPCQYVWIEAKDDVYYARRVICKNWLPEPVREVTIPWTEGVVRDVYDYNGNRLYFAAGEDGENYTVSLNEPIPPGWTYRLAVVADAPAGLVVSSSNYMMQITGEMIKGTLIVLPEGVYNDPRYKEKRPTYEGRSFTRFGQVTGPFVTYADVGNLAFRIYEREGRNAKSPMVYWDQALAKLLPNGGSLSKQPEVLARGRGYQPFIHEYTLHTPTADELATQAEEKQKVEIVFRNTPLKQVVRNYGGLCGRRVLISNEVNPNMVLTLQSEGKISREQALAMIEKMFTDVGLQLVDNGDVLVIEPLKEAADVDRTGKPATKVSLQFRDSPVKQVVQFYERLLGKAVMLSGQVDPAMKLTIQSGQKVSESQALKMMEAMFADAGLRLRENGGMMLVEPVEPAKPPAASASAGSPYEGVFGIVIPTQVPEHLVAGAFYMGDGLGYNLLLNLHPDGIFDCAWHGCMGLYGTTTGTWSVVANRIMITPVSETGMFTNKHLPYLDVLVYSNDFILVKADNYGPFLERGPSRNSCFQRKNVPSGESCVEPKSAEMVVMEDLGRRVAEGQLNAIDELEEKVEVLYSGTTFPPGLSKLTLVKAALTPVGEAAGEGSTAAWNALAYASGKRRLRPFAADAFGIAASMGNRDALNYLLNYSEHGFLLSSAVFALRDAAEKNMPEAVDFLIAVIENPQYRALWRAASEGLVGAAESGNEKAAQALRAYAEAQAQTDGSN